jgi:glycerophosphoryl diester phosphodiesterase
MKQIRVVLLGALIFSAAGCEKIKYEPDNPITGLPNTIILMHRGNGFNTEFHENTFPAAEYGLSVLDGVELDIQISKDGTLWLDHDNEVHDCDGNVVGCFQTLTDSEIFAASVCNDTSRYHTLESVFELMAADYPDSFISLDIKGQYCEIINTAETMRQMAESVLALVDKYGMQKKVLVESSSIEFLQELDNQSSVGQCVVSLGDVDEGIANAAYVKARGISLEYGVEEVDADVVSLVHKKGYGLILWVVNEPDDIVEAWDSKPDFIETDNADFKNYISRKK